MFDGTDFQTNLRGRVKIQKTASGKILGACLMIPAEVLIDHLPKDEIEYLETELKPTPEGIMVKIRGR